MSRADHGRGPRTRYVDEEEDFEFDRRRSSRPPPEYLRDDYGRNPNAGPMVLRERDKTVIEDDSSYSRASDRPGDRRVRNGDHRRIEEDELLVTRPHRQRAAFKDSEASGEEGQLLRRDRERDRIEDDRTEILYRERKNGRRESELKVVDREDVIRSRRGSSPPPLAREREEWNFAPRRPEKEQITIRERERLPAPRPPPPREEFREEINIRETEREPVRRPRSAYHEDDVRFVERDGRGYHEDEIDFRHTDRPPAPSAPPPRASWDEEILIRQREREREHEREPPRSRYDEENIRIRERSRPGYRDEEIDIRERSRGPPPARRGLEEEIDIREREKSRRGLREEDIDIDIHERERERERARPPPSAYHEDDIRIRDRSRPGFRDREISIRERDGPRERERPRPPPTSDYYYDDEIDIRERDRRGGRDEEIDIKERERDRRGVRSEDIDIRERERERDRRGGRDEEIDIRERERDRRGGREEEIAIRERDRSRRPPVDREREIVIRRNSSPSPEPVAQLVRRPRSASPEAEKDELVIKRSQSRSGRKEEIIIRRDRTPSKSPSPSPSPERVPSPPPPPPAREPEIIRAPTIHQEVITHHRHIDHGYEVQLPEPRPISRPEVRSPSPPPAPRTVYDEEIDIRRQGDRDGRRYDDNLAIERKVRETPERSRARTPLPEPRPRERTPPPRPKSALEIDIRRRGERNGEFYEDDVRFMDGVRSSRGLGERERERAEIGSRGGRTFAGGRPAEDRMWTELTKDLVVREALEGSGYEVQETEHYFYVMEYLRYDDVRRLVAISDGVRRDRERKERTRKIEWERRHAPPPMPSPGPPPALTERQWDEERIYERDVYYDKGRRVRVTQPAPKRETDEVVVKIK